MVSLIYMLIFKYYIIISIYQTYKNYKSRRDIGLGLRALRLGMGTGVTGVSEPGLGSVITSEMLGDCNSGIADGVKSLSRLGERLLPGESVSIPRSVTSRLACFT